VRPQLQTSRSFDLDDTGRLLIQVLPQLKPTRCGVSDLALLLARELNRGFGIRTAFVVLNSDVRSDVPYPVIHCAPAQLLESILKHGGGQACSILVHVSGYGYSSDGAPMLLADALEEVKEDGRFKTASYFHEISASGPPWTSAFWHAGRQKRAVRRIAEASDLLVTNIGANARLLAREIGSQASSSIQILAVLAASGESVAPIPVRERARIMAVFGLPASRRRAYTELATLPEFLHEVGIQEIVDIGASLDVPKAVHGIPVRRRGELGVTELAEEISNAMCGYVSYAAICLGKSSIFATYCAQGTIPLIAKPFDGEVDGLRDGVQVLSPATARRTVESGLDRCSHEAWKWYAGHNVRIHAETYARWMNQSAPVLERQDAGR